MDRVFLTAVHFFLSGCAVETQVGTMYPPAEPLMSSETMFCPSLIDQMSSIKETPYEKASSLSKFIELVLCVVGGLFVKTDLSHFMFRRGSLARNQKQKHGGGEVETVCVQLLK